MCRRGAAGRSVVALAPMLPYVLVIYMVVFWFGGLYEIMWEYAGMRDLARLTCLSGLATGFILLFESDLPSPAPSAVRC